MSDTEQMSYDPIHLDDLNIGDVVHIYFSNVLYTNREVTDINLGTGTLTDEIQKYPNVAGKGKIFLVSKAEIVYKPGDLVRVVSLRGTKLKTPVMGVVDNVTDKVLISVPSTTDEVTIVKGCFGGFWLNEDIEVAGVWE